MGCGRGLCPLVSGGGLVMWLVGLVDPGAESRRCSRRSLIVSVGLLGVPGRSRWAGASMARFLSVLPGVGISVGGVGALLLIGLIGLIIDARPWRRSACW